MMLLAPTSLICILLTLCSPANVSGFVIPVVVNAIDAMPPAWPRANVAIEVFKTIEPSSTNPDTPPAIVAVLPCLGVQTSILNVLPSAIFRRFDRPCLPMSFRRFRNALQVLAPATSRTSFSERVSSDCSQDATRTFAFPKSMSLIAASIFNYGQSPKSLTDQINGRPAASAAVLCEGVHLRECTRCLAILKAGSVGE